MKILIQILFLCSLLLAQFACASRVPSEKKSTKIIQRHFKKYAKKFTETEFSKNQLSSVEIKSISELQKDLVIVVALLKFGNGQESPIHMTLMRKYPMGWRQMGWENLKN